MKTNDLDFALPEELIAQEPADPRETAKLLHYSRVTGVSADLTVFDLPSLLRPDDLLVLNVASVLRARLFGVHERTGNPREVFLLNLIPGPTQKWEALVKGSSKVGDVIWLDTIKATIRKKRIDGTTEIELAATDAQLRSYLQSQGHVPVPPYIKKEPKESEYQTVYADPDEMRSVAAPTAGFHLSKNVLKRIEARGVQIEKVVLDVGLGTFQPIRTEELEDHKIHAEKIYISGETAAKINSAKNQGRRVVSVGTTTLRTLESAATDDGKVKEISGDTRLFITPGYRFKIVDALLTNFHLPKSSLLALVSAFVGSTEKTVSIYREVVEKKYRFFSFGDAMFIE